METTVKRIVEKPERVALCRRCRGTGEIYTPPGGEPLQALHTPQSLCDGSPNLGQQLKVCPQCEGSGRVMVSCKMELQIKPYRGVLEEAEAPKRKLKN